MIQRQRSGIYNIHVVEERDVVHVVKIKAAVAYFKMSKESGVCEKLKRGHEMEGLDVLPLSQPPLFFRHINTN